MWRSIQRFVRQLPCRTIWEQEEGQDLIEYGLLGALIAATAAAAVGKIAAPIGNMFQNAVDVFSH
jgi:Flp pilus assembly pilin Flp